MEFTTTKPESNVPIPVSSLDEELLEVIRCNQNAEAEKSQPVMDGTEEEQDQNDKEFNDWVEDEEDKDDMGVFGFFSRTRFPSIPEMIEFEKKTFQFDLQEVVSSNCSNSYEFIKLVNFIRSYLQENPSVQTSDSLLHNISSKAFLDERFLKPVLEDDSLLFLYEEYYQFPEEDD